MKFFADKNSFAQPVCVCVRGSCNRSQCTTALSSANCVKQHKVAPLQMLAHGGRLTSGDGCDPSSAPIVSQTDGTHFAGPSSPVAPLFSSVKVKIVIGQCSQKYNVSISSSNCAYVRGLRGLSQGIVVKYQAKGSQRDGCMSRIHCIKTLLGLRMFESELCSRHLPTKD